MEEFGDDAAAHGTERQGIVHMVGPETGRSQPGKFVVCGDSHTATHPDFWCDCFWYRYIRSGARFAHNVSGKLNLKR